MLIVNKGNCLVEYTGKERQTLLGLSLFLNDFNSHRSVFESRSFPVRELKVGVGAGEGVKIA